jgi:RNA polymerase sigma-70 factor, ECF subfamily
MDFPDDPRSDQALIHAAGAGEAGAFDVLYARYRQWVYRLSFRFTGHEDDAWDVHQETFLYLAGKLPTLRLTASLKTLLYTVVRSLAIKANHKRRRLVLDEELLAAVPAQASGQPADELREVLGDLDLRLRQVLLMRYVDDLSLDEIAQVLGIPLGTVKSRLHHAHQKVRASPRLCRYFDSA